MHNKPSGLKAGRFKYVNIAFLLKIIEIDFWILYIAVFCDIINKCD